jgi:hypothetical protein
MQKGHVIAYASR